MVCAGAARPVEHGDAGYVRVGLVILLIGGITAAFIPGKGSGGPAAANAAELARLLGSSRAMELAAVGTIGLVAIVWLMVMKPF
jgi:hypothetical protein